MSSDSQSLNWSTDLLLDCYNHINAHNVVDYEALSLLKNDLIAILTTPKKNDDSRKKLSDESKPIQFSNGDEFRLNQPFVEAAFLLSNEFDLNEVSTAELLYYSETYKYQKGTNFSDSARYAFYSRYQYILNILGYVVSTKQLHLIVSSDQYDKLFAQVLHSFEKIYSLLALQNDLIDKQKVTNNINDLIFINAVNYSKSQLFACHETLSQILYALIDNYFDHYGTLPYYKKIIEHINKNIADEDILTVHFLPAILKFFTNLFAGNDDSKVDQFHKSITASLITDYKQVSENDIIDLSKSHFKGYEITVDLFFFTFFTKWCKEQDSRTTKYDFKEDIVKYMEWTINYDVMDKLLCYASQTCNPETVKQFEYSNLYDFRSLLQRTFPRLAPTKFIYTSAPELNQIRETRPGFENVNILTDLSAYQVSTDFTESLLAPFLHMFFLDFVSNAALILISLRDSEEDFLLSSVNRKQLEDREREEEQDPSSKRRPSVDEEEKASSRKVQDKDTLDLDEISTKSDLERFYLAFAYTYTNRPELCSLFWSSDATISNDLMGFFSWGLSNNTSPLITATFCLLLGSLTYGGNDSALKIWDILVSNNVSNVKKHDYSKISIDSIVNSLNYYLDSLNENFEQNLNDGLRQQQKRPEFLFSSRPTASESASQTNESVVIELAEDSIVFISGFIQLISSIFKNLSPDARDTKLLAFNRFYPLINGFLYFDNLITGGKNLSVDVNSTSSNNPKLVDLPVIKVNEENRVVLINLILNLLNDIVENEQDLTIRFRVWEILDRWLYQGISDSDSSNSSQPKDPFLPQHSTRPKYISKRLVRLNQAFQTKLTNLSQVGNFINLISNLLTPLTKDDQAFAKYTLLYPANLGLGYRINNQIGIWPYIEYLMIEVFGKSDRMSDSKDTTRLKLQIVDIVVKSLSEIDWVFLDSKAPRLIQGFNLATSNEILDSLSPALELDYSAFIKLHHSLAFLNFLFDERAYKALVTILNIGEEAIGRNDTLAKLVEKTLVIVDKVLDLQQTFANSLLPILKDQKLINKAVTNSTTSYNLVSSGKPILDNVYIPSTVGNSGINNFYEILLFNLSTIPNIALYVGNANSHAIPLSSISILKKVSSSHLFTPSGSDRLGLNRLLTIFESIDESIKIKFAFIEQFQTDDFNLKTKILEFLLQNLRNSTNGKEVTVSHFLLGFDIHGGNLLLDASSSDDSKNSLLKVLVDTLEFSLESVGDGYNIEFGPSSTSSLVLEILIKLSQDSISSLITLNYLRDYHSLFEKLLGYQPKIDIQTLWEGSGFDGDLDDSASNNFIVNPPSYRAFLSFINQRTLILQYLSLEFHHTQSITKKDQYVKLLLNNNTEFLNGSPKVLNFLDILNFKFKNLEIGNAEPLGSIYNLDLILDEVKKPNFELDFSILEKVVKLNCQVKANQKLNTGQSTMLLENTLPQNTIQFGQNSGNNELTPTEGPTGNSLSLIASEIVPEVILESNKLHNFVNKYLLASNLRDTQLQCLHSWCQLVEILITDPKISTKYFILEVLQVTLPKINDYLETDIYFSEELISLSVLLFDLYDKEILEKSGNEDFIQNVQRLTSLFKTCISGILNSNSTPSLRSNLYVLTNKFLAKVFKSELLIAETSSIIKSVDKKFIETILNDSIYSEGSSRITSILLLESLIHLSSFSAQNFVLDILIKNNSLLLLVKSIKRTDELVESLTSVKSESTVGGLDGSEGISLDLLLFELTAFKSTLYFLIRVAQSKTGALQLIQCEIFSILKQCSILKINPDLGLNLSLEEFQDNLTINLVLDSPIGLADLGNQQSSNNVSYFEFLIPIFQLIISINLSMGPSYKPSLTQSKELVRKFDSLVVGILKRDLLIENKQLQGSYKEDSVSLSGLKELVKLLTILDSLIKYEA